MIARPANPHGPTAPGPRCPSKSRPPSLARAGLTLISWVGLAAAVAGPATAGEFQAEPSAADSKFQTISNVMKNRTDTIKNSIRNINNVVPQCGVFVETKSTKIEFEPIEEWTLEEAPDVRGHVRGRLTLSRASFVTAKARSPQSSLITTPLTDLTIACSGDDDQSIEMRFDPGQSGGLATIHTTLEPIERTDQSGLRLLHETFTYDFDAFSIAAQGASSTWQIDARASTAGASLENWSVEAPSTKTNQMWEY